MNVTALSALLTPVLAGYGLELDDLTVVPAGRRSLLRVTVDGDGTHGRGPTLDEIHVASRAVSDALDASPLTGNAPYVLEVSSRGVGKPLTRPAHWRRNQGRLVALTTAGEAVTGRIVVSDESGVTLDVDQTKRTFAYGDLSRAVVKVELNRKADPSLDDEDAQDEDAEIDTDEIDTDEIQTEADETEADDADEQED